MQQHLRFNHLVVHTILSKNISTTVCHLCFR